MILIYFDICCLCRLFDDLTSALVADELSAIREIQRFIRSGELFLVWSYVLNEENSCNTDPRKQAEVASWERHAISHITKSDAVETRSLLIRSTGVKKMDSLHVSCAIEGGCQFFITTDHRLLKYQSTAIKICDPIECLSILHQIL